MAEFLGGSGEFYVEGERILVSHKYGLGIVFYLLLFLSVDSLGFGERSFSVVLESSSSVFCLGIFDVPLWVVVGGDRGSGGYFSLGCYFLFLVSFFDRRWCMRVEIFRR